MTICHETRTITIVVVDLFCGAGGLSEGAKAAVARIQAEYPGWAIIVIHIAINCWDVAIATHRANHPDALQICQRIEAVRPSEVLAKLGITIIDLLCAAPECIFFSRARGGAPVNDQRRSGAWLVPAWCSECEVLAVLIENVREIQEWGPLDPATKRPDKKRRSAIFHAWLQAFQAMGFIVNHRVICCADLGDATTRERWFLLGRKDGRAFDFPKPKYASPFRLAKLREDAEKGGSLFPPNVNLEPWKTARNDVIDWGLKGPSIFEREAIGMTALVENTLMRIDAGLSKFNGAAGLPFVIALRHFMGRMPGLQPEIGPPPPPIVMKGGEKFRVESVMVTLRQHADGESVDQPVSTVCASGTHIGVAEPSLVKFYGNGSAEAVGDPLDTVTSIDRFGVVEPAILHHRTFDKQCVDSVDNPLRTVRAESATIQIAEPVLTRFQGGAGAKSKRAQSIDDPVTTVDTSNRFGVADPTLISIDQRGSNGSCAYGPDEPIRTVHTEPTFSVAEPALVNMKGESDASGVDAPSPTQTTAYHLYVSEPFLTPHQKFGQVGTDSIDAPHRTITANNGKDNGLVEPVIVPQFSEATAKSVDDPLGTVTTVARPGVAEPFITPGFGEREGQEWRVYSVEVPIGTIAATGHFHVCQAFLIDVNHGNGDEDPAKANARRAHSINDPISTVTASRRGKALVIPVLIKPESGKTRPGYQLVTDEGTLYIEILFRMLQWYELARAHSYPADYVFHGTKGDKVKQIGNSVPIATATELAYEQLIPLFRDLVPVLEECVA